MSFQAVLAPLMESKNATIAFLRQHNCIRRAVPACPICGRIMTVVNNLKNGMPGWRCPDHKGRKVYPLTGSFFQSSKCPVPKLIGLIWCWSKDLSNNKTMDLLGVSDKTVIEWFRKLRGISAWWLTQNPHVCGGVGIICEIDESLVAKEPFIY